MARPAVGCAAHRGALPDRGTDLIVLVAEPARLRDPCRRRIEALAVRSLRIRIEEGADGGGGGSIEARIDAEVPVETLHDRAPAGRRQQPRRKRDVAAATFGLPFGIGRRRGLPFAGDSVGDQEDGERETRPIQAAMSKVQRA